MECPCLFGKDETAWTGRLVRSAGAASTTRIPAPVQETAPGYARPAQNPTQSPSSLSMHGIALKYFVEVAQEGSLSAASRHLHVAVSAISRQIAALEEEVGAPLFERAARGMVLSEAGRLLLAHARRTLMESAAVLQQIASLQEAPRDALGKVIVTFGVE